MLSRRWAGLGPRGTTDLEDTPQRWPACLGARHLDQSINCERVPLRSGVHNSGVYAGFGFNNENATTFDTTIQNTLTMDIMQSDVGNFVSVTNLVLSKVY